MNFGLLGAHDLNQSSALSKLNSTGLLAKLHQCYFRLLNLYFSSQQYMSSAIRRNPRESSKFQLRINTFSQFGVSFGAQSARGGPRIIRGSHDQKSTSAGDASDYPPLSQFPTRPPSQAPATAPTRPAPAPITPPTTAPMRTGSSPLVTNPLTIVQCSMGIPRFNRFWA